MILYGIQGYVIQCFEFGISCPVSYPPGQAGSMTSQVENERETDGRRSRVGGRSHRNKVESKGEAFSICKSTCPLPINRQSMSPHLGLALHARRHWAM